MRIISMSVPIPIYMVVLSCDVMRHRDYPPDFALKLKAGNRTSASQVLDHLAYGGPDAAHSLRLAADDLS